ncbi:MAG: FecR family protein [bacterium]
MNKATSRIILLILISFLVGGTINIVSPYNAIITGISGEVYKKRYNDSVWVIVKDGDILIPGDQLKTVYNSRARLKFSDGSIVEVGQDTNVNIYDNYLFLTIGIIKSYITKLFPNFEVRTPTAIAGVRGTEFTVEVLSDQTTIVSVYEGIVEVTTKERTIKLKKGETTIVKPPTQPGSENSSSEKSEEISNEHSSSNHSEGSSNNISNWQGNKLEDSDKKERR